jgi:hypothetical protein
MSAAVFATEPGAGLTDEAVAGGVPVIVSAVVAVVINAVVVSAIVVSIGIVIVAGTTVITGASADNRAGN